MEQGRCTVPMQSLRGADLCIMLMLPAVVCQARQGNPPTVPRAHTPEDMRNASRTWGSSGAKLPAAGEAGAGAGPKVRIVSTASRRPAMASLASGTVAQRRHP